MPEFHQDAVAIVTGGAAGIGAAIVERLVNAGVRVAVWDIDAKRLAESQAYYGERVLAQRVDVSDQAQVEAAATTVHDRWGAVSLLVNNAGIIGRRMRLGELDAAELDRVLAINLKSVFFVSHAYLRVSEGAEQRAVVNLASIAARTGGMLGNMIYATTKGAIVSLTVALAKDLAPHVRVNALAPGVVDTEIQADVFGDKAMMARMFEHIPLGRAGQPGEVADAACWLLSSSSSYVTGTLVDVSGGR